MVGRSEKAFRFPGEYQHTGGGGIYTCQRERSPLLAIMTLHLPLAVLIFTAGKARPMPTGSFSIRRNSLAPIGRTAFLQYFQPEPGTYRIQFKVLSLNNSWPDQNQGRSGSTYCLPFWQKPWFIILLVLALLCLLYLFIRWRTEAARKRKWRKRRCRN